jgi:hypothetical protein
MRLKPAQDLDDWMHAVKLASPDVHFDPFSKVDSYALMRNADVIFTYGSTSGVEAGFIGKPVVVMGPSAYDTLECARRITTAEEIGLCLAEPPHPNTAAAIPYGLMMQRRGFNFAHIQKFSDGEMSLGGISLSEANELTRRVSDWLRRKRISTLNLGEK